MIDTILAVLVVSLVAVSVVVAYVSVSTAYSSGLLVARRLEDSSHEVLRIRAVMVAGKTYIKVSNIGAVRVPVKLTLYPGGGSWSFNLSLGETRLIVASGKGRVVVAETPSNVFIAPVIMADKVSSTISLRGLHPTRVLTGNESIVFMGVVWAEAIVVPYTYIDGVRVNYTPVTGVVSLNYSSLKLVNGFLVGNDSVVASSSRARVSLNMSYSSRLGSFNVSYTVSSPLNYTLTLCYGISYSTFKPLFGSIVFTAQRTGSGDKIFFEGITPPTPSSTVQYILSSQELVGRVDPFYLGGVWLTNAVCKIVEASSKTSGLEQGYASLPDPVTVYYYHP